MILKHILIASQTIYYRSNTFNIVKFKAHRLFWSPWELIKLDNPTICKDQSID